MTGFKKAKNALTGSTPCAKMLFNFMIKGKDGAK